MRPLATVVSYVDLERRVSAIEKQQTEITVKTDKLEVRTSDIEQAQHAAQERQTAFEEDARRLRVEFERSVRRDIDRLTAWMSPATKLGLQVGGVVFVVVYVLFG